MLRTLAGDAMCSSSPCYVGLLLLARERMRNIPSRLWLDGVIGALAHAALAPRSFASCWLPAATPRRRENSPIRSQMFMLGTYRRHAAARGRIDRSRASRRVGRLRRPDRSTHRCGGQLCNGRSSTSSSAGTLLMALAAGARCAPRHGRRARSSSLPYAVLASLGLLIYDQCEARTCSVVAPSAAIIAVLIRLRSPRQSRRTSSSAPQAADASPARNRSRCGGSTRAGPGGPHVLPSLPRRFKVLQRLYGHPGLRVRTRLGTRWLPRCARPAFPGRGDESASSPLAPDDDPSARGLHAIR